MITFFFFAVGGIVRCVIVVLELSKIVGLVLVSVKWAAMLWSRVWFDSDNGFCFIWKLWISLGLNIVGLCSLHLVRYCFVA